MGPDTVAVPKTHYLQTPQISLIFLAFFVLTLPLAGIDNFQLLAPHTGEILLLAYVLLVGNTHFAITWVLYLNSQNLTYFRSSLGRRLVYFFVPLLLLVGFCVQGMLSVPPRGTSFALVFAVLLITVDYYHVIRQSFGVLQLFKARVGHAFPAKLRQLENFYFLALWLLQLITFIRGTSHDFDGYFDPTDPLTRGVLAVTCALLLLIAHAWFREWRRAGNNRRALLTAAAYLLLQSAAAALVVYRSRLYLASLAMHYVEYHVLMAPRCFRSELDLTQRVDRWATRLRRRKYLVYGAILLVAVCMQAWQLFDMAGLGASVNSTRFGWFFVNCLNGIFFAHYFVEAFLWKFKNPFYRKTLAPLYFP